MEKATQIGVVVRMRPLLPQEEPQQSSPRVIPDPESHSIMQVLHRVTSLDQRNQKRFRFDKVFDQTTPQKTLFEQCQISQLIRQVIAGFNGTIFAYGQTGSGKTFTMDGYKYDKHFRPLIKDDENIGVIPRVIRSLYQELRQSPVNLQYTVYCSFIQIYKQQVFDLLNSQKLKPPGLKVRWSKRNEFYVQNLSYHPCGTSEQVLAFYHIGLKNKVMASHNLNKTSSRSHCLLGLTLEIVDSSQGSIHSSKLQLVDLAGSERVGQTGNQGNSMKQSININKSLFTLRQVISTLSTSKQDFVPYRDSKLTSLLKQSIGGNSFCLMIACLAPLDSYYDENLSTLTYATHTSSITNQPVKNVDPKTKIVISLKDQVSVLKQELAAAYKQIDLLTQMLSLNKSQQVEKLNQIDTQDLPADQVKRIQAMRVSINSAPVQSPKKQSEEPLRKLPPRKAPNSYLSAELLSEKLQDSVKLIKQLMNQNNKLKETINDITQGRKQLEAQLLQLQFQNSELMERLEAKQENQQEDQAFQKLLQQKEALEKRVQQIQNENKQIQTVFQQKSQPKIKQEWGWRSKRTVVRAQSPAFSQALNLHTERPGSVKRQSTRQMPRNRQARVSERPISQRVESRRESDSSFYNPDQFIVLY